jgi:hypothetical protein
MILLGGGAGDETGPGGFTAFDVASDPVQSSPVQKEKRTDFFLSGMSERVGLDEPGHFLRIDFCDAKLDDTCSGNKGTGLLLSIPMSDGYLDGAEDTAVALGLVGTLKVRT